MNFIRCRHQLSEDVACPKNVNACHKCKNYTSLSSTLVECKHFLLEELLISAYLEFCRLATLLLY